MSVQHLSGSTAAPAMPAARLIAVIGLTLALAYAVVLAGAWLGGTWLVDAHGQPIANDFVNVWAAGRLALDGHAAAAYDWTLHKAAEVRAVGYAFDNYYGWHYPPTFLFAAAALALMPYSAAALVWLGVTLPAYVAAVRGIIGTRAGIFVALGCPAVLWNASAGQNGLLTAALIGGTLGLMQRRPWLAGVCLGLLSYKPHFGLLFPIALIAGSQWRVIAAAALVAAGMAALSLIAFGAASWQAFFDWMPVTSRVVLGEGGADWSRLQSLFGFVRAHGGGETLAWSAQGTLALMLGVAIAWLWRSRVAFELKAAGLACAALLATPYLYIYDLVALAVPVAFLLRLALKRGFFASEVFGLSAAVALLLSYPYVKTQVGLAATAIVAGLIMLRGAMAARGESVTPKTH
jgi:arabinofuranan 3-O-arabinosyltransferase